MNHNFKHFTLLCAVLIFAGCSSPKTETEKIDRFAVINRHNVYITEFDTLNSLTAGNGKFAITVDATGLQTFPELYENGVCLGTQSEWGWHSFPNTQDFKPEEAFQYFEVEGRKVPYAVQWKEPGRKQDAANYFRVNPHRLHLGMIGLELLNADNSSVAAEQITNNRQELNVWKGLISSTFQIENHTFNVNTRCHPYRDLIGIQLHSDRIKKGLTGISLKFPYPTGNFTDSGAGWNFPEKHQSKITEQDSNSAVILHSIDTTTYFLKINWTGKAKLREKKMHYFVLMPDSENTQISISVEFSEKNKFQEPLAYHQINELSETKWKDFWETGGAVDFSGTADPRAFELERRVVLSQYLTRVQCAGKYPPQETGLTFNSWYGKPHLEMHWWHGVHWAYWNRTELLEKSLGYYFDIFEKARQKAEIQGYSGIRWPKMTDLYGNDSPSGVGEFLIWQQPHIIYFAELCYRQHPDRETLEKYAPLIFATAGFMADFARWDGENKRFILGPPLIPAQESLEKDKTFNPPFELAYWHWGLSMAQKWRERMGLQKNEAWQNVIDQLPGFAQKNGLYLAAESAPDSYQNEHYYSDHPMVLGAFGMLPGTVEMDTLIMSATFDHIEKTWNWERTWGWDYPMAAMCAIRLGKPEKAVDLLLKDVKKNTWLKNGHNWQDNRLRIYLPGNGGLLTAVAMMCAGYEGNTTPNPGFPKHWKVKWENLEPVF
jgi:hypothetical protein